MSVLIKGMEVPTNCADCPLNYDQMACAVTWTRWWSDSMVMMNFDSDKERLPNCPLIEVHTPHGRLIDADEIEYENWYLEETGENYKMVGKDDIDGMSAIIEAEE